MAIATRKRGLPAVAVATRLVATVGDKTSSLSKVEASFGCGPRHNTSRSVYAWASKDKVPAFSPPTHCLPGRRT